MNQLWSPLANHLNPYVPGAQPKESNIIKLNTNENPYPPSPKVLEAINRATNENLRKYPDPESEALKRAIAAHASLTPDHVFVGNGSDEVLGITFFALFKKSKPTLFPDITYSFYPVYSRLVDIDTDPLPLTEDLTIDWTLYLSKNQNDIGGIIFPNPNAPTGLATALDDLEALLLRFPNTPIVVDEAYVDFGAVSALPLIEKYANLLVVQTLSKAYSLAGLRVGFALGQPHLIEALNRVKNSFNSYPIDRLAQAGAIAAIEDQAYLKTCVAKIIKTRASTEIALKALGFHCLDSKANFLFVTHPELAAENLYLQLSSQSIFVRHFTKSRINNYCRISIGTDSEMHTLIGAIKAILTDRR